MQASPSHLAHDPIQEQAHDSSSQTQSQKSQSQKSQSQHSSTPVKQSLTAERPHEDVVKLNLNSTTFVPTIMTDAGSQKSLSTDAKEFVPKPQVSADGTASVERQITLATQIDDLLLEQSSKKTLAVDADPNGSLFTTFKTLMADEKVEKILTSTCADSDSKQPTNLYQQKQSEMSQALSKLRDGKPDFALQRVYIRPASTRTISLAKTNGLQKEKIQEILDGMAHVEELYEHESKIYIQCEALKHVGEVTSVLASKVVSLESVLERNCADPRKLNQIRATHSIKETPAKAKSPFGHLGADLPAMRGQAGGRFRMYSEQVQDQKQGGYHKKFLQYSGDQLLDIFKTMTFAASLPESALFTAAQKHKPETCYNIKHSIMVAENRRTTLCQDEDDFQELMGSYSGQKSHGRGMSFNVNGEEVSDLVPRNGVSVGDAIAENGGDTDDELSLKKTTVLTGKHVKKNAQANREQRGRAASEADQNLLLFKSNLALSNSNAKEAITGHHNGTSNVTFQSLIGGLGATNAESELIEEEKQESKRKAEPKQTSSTKGSNKNKEKFVLKYVPKTKLQSGAEADATDAPKSKKGAGNAGKQHRRKSSKLGGFSTKNGPPGGRPRVYSEQV